MALIKLKRPVDEELVSILQTLTERAKAGELISVALCGQIAGESVATAYHVGQGDYAHLIAGLEQVKYRLLRIE